MSGQFSAFAPSGIRFSSRKPLSEVIYEDTREAYGSLYADNFNGEFSARIFAKAKCLGIAREQLQRAANQSNPRYCNELLPKLESDYQLSPPPGATRQQRRRALMAATAAKRGSTLAALSESLTELLGSDFVALVPQPMADFALAHGIYPPTTNPQSGPGNFAPIGATFKVLRLTTNTFESTVGFVRIAGNNEPLFSGELLTIDPDKTGLIETVTVGNVVDNNGVGTFTATFTKPHGSGAHATTAGIPYWRTPRRIMYVVVAPSVLQDGVTLNLINRLMEKATKATVVWSICAESAPGKIGPFLLGQSGLGQDPITEITF
jgi:hypothetical protein